LPSQHTKEPPEETAPVAGIVVPWDLPEFRVVQQTEHADGSLSVTVRAVKLTATCPHCQGSCDTLPDCRSRRKRDVSLRGYRVHLVVLKRRFACPRCQKTFTEPDAACGERRRTTCRLRETIGRQVATQTVASVSRRCGGGPRCARECFQTVRRPQLAQRGLELDGQGKFPTPRYLGIDECAVRKGQRSATILCDLEGRGV
jgi:transposase